MPCSPASPTRSSPPTTSTFELRGLTAAGSAIGAGWVHRPRRHRVFVDAAYRLSRFLFIESCGQVPPARSAQGRSPPGWNASRPASAPRTTSPPSTAGSSGDRRQPLLPRRRGTTARQQRPAGLPESSSSTSRPTPAPAPVSAPHPQAPRPGGRRRHLRRAVLGQTPDWTYGSRLTTAVGRPFAGGSRRWPVRPQAPALLPARCRRASPRRRRGAPAPLAPSRVTVTARSRACGRPRRGAAPR